MTSFPSQAEVVIVGGGVMGVSVAFHLAEAGVRDIVLLDRGPLGAGSTSKAAGGVRAQFADELNVLMGARSLELLENFRRRPAQDIDLHRVGYLFALTRAEDVATFEGAVTLQQSHGVPSRIIDPHEAARLSPLLRIDDVLAAAYSPDDGHCSPDSVVLGYAAGARRFGANLLTGVDVQAIETHGGEVIGVRSAQGTIDAGVVVCCAGAWSRDLAMTAGVDLPVTPYRRQIVVTEPLPFLDELPPAVPMTIDYASSFYFHREGPGLLMGMSDPDEPPGFDTHVDEAFLDLLAQAAGVRAPRVLEVGVAHRWAGLYEVTPDHNALLGEAADVSRFLYACGFSGHGFLQGPAVGEIMRDLVLGREAFVDVSPLDAGRFSDGALRRETYVV
jgi:sarcosine oxidase, subunit beta